MGAHSAHHPEDLPLFTLRPGQLNNSALNPVQDSHFTKYISSIVHSRLQSEYTVCSRIYGRRERGAGVDWYERPREMPPVDGLRLYWCSTRKDQS